MILEPLHILSIVLCYFILLMLVSFMTSKNVDNDDFFVAGRRSPWYLVAFGMIGASLSGVTFISIPGMVGAAYLNPDVGAATNMQFSYMQVVMGYLLGYVFIALVLLPLYYKLKLTSIYSYLEQRFGSRSYKTGAAFFLISRIVGASFRLYLVAMVFYLFIFQHYQIPFWMVSLLTIILIWLYTFKGGIKTIVWTDTLQTLFMLLAVFFTVYELIVVLGLDLNELWSYFQQEGLAQVFFFENGWSDANNFYKQFFSGAFIAIVMTGLDQDMMQKNLSCKNIGDAQKNMFSFSIVLFFVNFIFLALGALLAVFALKNGIIVDRSDSLYPTIALKYLSWEVAVFFIIGLVAAAYSSADSALTSLTTSFCVDFLDFNKDQASKNQDAYNQSKQEKTRKVIHVVFSLILFLVITAFWLINDQSVINALFKFAGYTYGPLLGLYSFGLFTKYKVRDQLVPLICVLSPILTYFINSNSETLFWNYKFGFELLILNGLITCIGLYLIKVKEHALNA